VLKILTILSVLQLKTNNRDWKIGLKSIKSYKETNECYPFYFTLGNWTIIIHLQQKKRLHDILDKAWKD